MTQTIRFGIVGCGSIVTRAHLPALQRIAGAKVTAVCDINKERAEAAAQQCGAKAYTDFEAVASHPEVDAVLIATPNAYHRDPVLAAARARKAVLCEKPIATNLADAKEMVAACERARVPLQIGFHQRFNPPVQLARRLLQLGVLGEVKAFRGVMSEPYHVYPAVTNYRYDLKVSGGNIVIDLAIHGIDVLRHLLGDVRALCATVRHSAVPAKVDDNACLLMDLASSATGSMSADRFSPGGASAFDLYGTKGTLYLSTHTYNPFQSAPIAVLTTLPFEQWPQELQEHFYSQAWWLTPRDTWVTAHPVRQDPYQQQLQAFCKSITHGEPVQVTGEDGIRALEIVLAAYKSAKEQAWVKLPLTEDVVEPPKFS
ncbi:MAG: Gfo/Idh/MocA family oxidoreductase [Deinococcus sp.]|nr:Gfo/Idh/MocA family oxidoreductase [Deinococcus sp.]